MKSVLDGVMVSDCKSEEFNTHADGTNKVRNFASHFVTLAAFANGNTYGAKRGLLRGAGYAGWNGEMIVGQNVGSTVTNDDFLMRTNRNV